MRDIIYDKIIPLGDRCNCTQNLKYYGLRPIGRKFPFDWVKGGDLKSRIDVIMTDFSDFLVADRLQQIIYARPEQGGNYRFYDTKTKLVFAHDFPRNLSFADGFQLAVRTFAPKINRFMNVFAAKEKVLLVYMTDKHIPTRQIKQYVQMLRQKFDYNDIDMLIIENGIKTFWYLHRQNISTGITRIKTRFYLMPLHFQDTTQKQFSILDKIFKCIKVKADDTDVYVK